MFEDDFQNLAVGLIDGAIIIIDLILGIEKHFLEKHPSQITTMAFWEDKCLISGSVDGRVNLTDIENLDKKKGSKVRFQKQQNTMDRKIPVACIRTSPEFGIGMAVDIEGNCRFYDLTRYRKFSKLSAAQARAEDVRLGPSKFSMMLPNSLQMTNDAFVAVTQMPKIYWDESHR